MSDSQRHPPLAIRVDDVRVDRSAPSAMADEPDTGSADVVAPVGRSGWFGRSLERVLDSWHMLPTEPWW